MWAGPSAGRGLALWSVRLYVVNGFFYDASVSFPCLTLLLGPLGSRWLLAGSSRLPKSTKAPLNPHNSKVTVDFGASQMESGVFDHFTGASAARRPQPSPQGDA